VKIEKTSKPLSPSAVGEGQARGIAAKTAGQTSSAPTGDASVNLGATSAQLRSMEASMANSPLVDVAKVAEIKQAISEGRFQVNSGVVADRLIQTVKDLVGAQKT
jgi:negative regulator of flagellin synthesis FlgM